MMMRERLSLVLAIGLLMSVGVPGAAQAVVLQSRKQPEQVSDLFQRAPQFQGLFQRATQHRAYFRLISRAYERAKELCRHDRKAIADDPLCQTYWKAFDRCMEERQVINGTVFRQKEKYLKRVWDVACPNINDSATFSVFLEQIVEEKRRQSTQEAPAVPEQTSLEPQLQFHQLSGRDRRRLNLFRRLGECPESLKTYYLPGYYELCRSLQSKEEK